MFYTIKIEDNNCGIPTELLCVPTHYKDDLENVLIPYGLILDRYLILNKKINRLFNNSFQN